MENKKVMEKVFKLFGAEVIQRDLHFYILQGVVNHKASASLTPSRHLLIKEIANQVNDLMDCLNIPKHALYAPIAADYVKFNSQPNFGEVVGAKM